MDDPSDELDALPWEELDRAFGDNGVSYMLRRLARGDVTCVIIQALDVISPLGVVEEVSLSAVPFLLALARVTQGSVLRQTMSLLEPFAQGNSRDAGIRARCARAIEPGFPRFVELLKADEAGVRVRAARFVAAFPERARGAQAEFEAALDAEVVPAARAEFIVSYDRFVDHEDEGVRARLRALVGDPDETVAARAGFALLKSVTHQPDPGWIDAVAQRVTRAWPRAGDIPRSSFHISLIVRDTPDVWRGMLLDALLRAFPDASERWKAFEVARPLLWLAFRARLGVPARRPRPFVLVESIDFPMPREAGGYSPERTKPDPRIHWRKPEDLGPDVDCVCAPNLRWWDDPQVARWQEQVGSEAAPAVTIAEPVTADSMTADERRVVEALARSGAFWRTDSDLPMVYGLPARRRDFAALVGL